MRKLIYEQEKAAEAQDPQATQNRSTAGGPPDHKERDTRNDAPEALGHWTVDERADGHSLYLAAESIADIAEAVTQVDRLVKGGQLATPAFQRACRRISVSIRKLILSGDTQILWRCFVPRLHPLLKPPNGFPADKLTQWMGEQSIGFTHQGATTTERVTFPTDHTTETFVNPLYGLRRTEERTYALAELADWSSPPIRGGQWLNAKVLQVDETIITAEDLLNMMVNREGAHSELNEMVRLNPGGPMDIKMGDAQDEKYRKANIVEFDGISYVQIFAFLTGHYLARMMRATLRHLPEDLTRGHRTTDVWETIINTPTRLPPLRMYLDRPYIMAAIYHNTGEGLELIGDYRTPSRTVVQIPGWN